MATAEQSYKLFKIALERVALGKQKNKPCSCRRL